MIILLVGILLGIGCIGITLTYIGECLEEIRDLLKNNKDSQP